MRSVPVVIAGLLLAAFAAGGSAQSLAELAKKEKERRAAIKTEAKVINNEKAAQAVGSVSAAQPPGTDAEKPAAAGETKPAAEPGTEKARPVTDEPVDFQGRTESYWRQTFADARKRVAELENQTNVIVLKLTDLQNQFYREANGFKQQTIQREIQKTLFEQDKTKENLAQAKADLVDLEREARKSGALPGWFRDK
jgi:hypothetical protein